MRGRDGARGGPMEFFDFSWVAEPSAWTALLALSLMEIVLGVDNIVFISILTGKLPREQQPRARQIGLAIALVSRLALLFCITWLMGLTKVFATIDVPLLGEWKLSGKGLILLAGGLFLLYKATTELWEKLEGPRHDSAGKTAVRSFGLIMAQIAVLDLVFSLDSVITAVGMAEHLSVMAVAMILAVIVMLVFVNTISDFIDKHPSLKILALAFLLLIGVMLVAEGTGQHMPKGYIYSAMAFSLLVEMFNMRFRARHAPVQLHGDPMPPSAADGEPSAELPADPG